MVGWVGDSREGLYPHFFADTDIAGDIENATINEWLLLRDARAQHFFPIYAGGKRQYCVAHSTPEAELEATDFGLRTDGLPALSLWRVIFPHRLPLLFHE
jgi:hypothetical protein